MKHVIYNKKYLILHITIMIMCIFMYVPECKAKESFKIGYVKNVHPLQYEEKGELSGIFAVTCKEIEKALNIDADYISYDNHELMLEALISGHIDMAVGVERSMEYEGLVKYSESCWQYMNALVQRNDTDYTDYENKSYAVVEGECSQLTYDYMINSKVYVADYRAAVEAVLNKEADCTIMNYFSASYYVSEMENDELSMITVAEIEEVYMAFSINEDEAFITDVNTAMYEMPAYEMVENLYIENYEKKPTLINLIKEYPFRSIFVIVLIIVTIGVLFFLYINSLRKLEMQQRENMERIAYTDELTQILNRKGFFKRLDEINNISDCGQGYMYAIVDMDNFKLVNDTLGHTAGDKALYILSQILKEQITWASLGCAGRFGGDEFVIYCREISYSEAGKMLSNIVSQMDTTMSESDKEVKLSVSVGAIYSERNIGNEKFMELADGVLYRCKEVGKNRFELRQV